MMGSMNAALKYVAALIVIVMVELPVSVYEQNNQKGIVVVFTTILLVIPCLISGLQLNNVSCHRLL